MLLPVLRHVQYEDDRARAMTPWVARERRASEDILAHAPVVHDLLAHTPQHELTNLSRQMWACMPPAPLAPSDDFLAPREPVVFDEKSFYRARMQVGMNIGGMSSAALYCLLGAGVVFGDEPFESMTPADFLQGLTLTTGVGAVLGGAASLVGAVCQICCGLRRTAPADDEMA